LIETVSSDREQKMRPVPPSTWLKNMVYFDKLSLTGSG
jgi:hypothetical protein